uniref:Astacin domain-containing protein n=1 Tax=Strongyloides papillosus TaxID=174720 RepID=A0A0N5C2Q8_STREA
MKNFFLILAVQLCIVQNSMEQNSKINIQSSGKPPYYKDLLTSTPYYVDKKIDTFITTKSITIQGRFLNATDEIFDTFYIINQETCLNFIKNEALIKDSIGINFLVGNKNEVTLSNSSNFPTNVTLQEDVYKNAKSLTFYIGLALGLIPEVRRPDRQIDVNVDMENVIEEYKKYYEIANKSNVPYLNDTDFDFKSAMFFDSNFGLLKGKQSTYTVKLYKDYQYPSYVSKSFSHNDYKHMYYYYCDWSKIQNNCKNGGFPVPNDKNRCKCPYYLTGDKCEEFFPDYHNPIYYNAKHVTTFSLMANSTEQCVSVNLKDELLFLKVTSKNGKNVSIVIEDLKFERTNCKIGRSYLEIFIREDKGAAGINLCKDSENITLPALSKEVFLVFKAYYENTSLSFSFKED